MKNVILFLRIFHKAAMLILPYLISVPALALNVIIRIQIGANVFAPWTNKPAGKGKGYYKSSFYIRLWTIFWAYLWIRLFLIFTFVNDPWLFNANELSTWKRAFEVFYSLSFSYTFPKGAMFFFIYSYVAVAAALLQLLIFQDILPKNLKPQRGDLGFSLIFSWFEAKNKSRFLNRYHIWSFADPVLISLIGFILFKTEYPIHAWFFWISAFAMAIQGNARRMKHNSDIEDFEDALKTREATQQQKSQYDQESLTKELYKEEKSDDGFATHA